MNARETYRNVFPETTSIPSSSPRTRAQYLESSTTSRTYQPLGAPTLEKRLRMRSNSPSQTSR